MLDAERDFYQRMNANPLRGLYSLSVEATEAIAKVRQQIADVIGAPQANEVVFTRNTSESLNLVCQELCAHGPRTGRRGRHHHHGAPLQPDSVAAGLP